MSRVYYELFCKLWGVILTLLERIKILREINGNISINKLEKEAGLTRGSMAKWDIHTPSYDKLKKVADFFGVTVDYLLGTSEEIHTKKEPAPEVRDKLDEDIWNAITQIPDEKREEALRYLQYLASQSEQ